MSSLKSWALLFCFAVIICAMFEMLVPNGIMEKVMYFVLGLFFVCVVVGPVLSVPQKIKLNLTHQREIQTEQKLKRKVEDQTKNLAAKRLEGVIRELLRKKQTNVKKFEIFMDTGEDSSISISKVRLFLDSENYAEEEQIKKLLKKELGINAEICSCKKER